jgi:hypothetical protein
MSSSSMRTSQKTLSIAKNNHGKRFSSKVSAIFVVFKQNVVSVEKFK